MINELKKNLAYYDFSDPVIQKIVKYLYKEEIQEIEPAKILNRINDPDASSFICNLLVSDLEIKDRKKSFEDCIKKIKTDKVKDKLDILQQQIKQAEKEDSKKIRSLLQEYSNLKKEQKLYEKGN